jgi:hypothetical protein
MSAWQARLVKYLGAHKFYPSCKLLVYFNRIYDEEKGRISVNKKESLEKIVVYEENY